MDNGRLPSQLLVLLICCHQPVLVLKGSQRSDRKFHPSSTNTPSPPAEKKTSDHLPITLVLS
uniref:Uncharacterized protein n=1 Tax=Setaria viridis TaxID=4556 RepID=A0A4U6TN63_SETVI|nr:hypothetical protein SEVIR_7G090701v2 [Setaria viridis]